MAQPEELIKDEARLKKLDHYEIMDSQEEAMFDELTLLASQILDVPIAYISLIDGERQWFKSKVGLDINETPIDISFCKYTILDDKPLIVNNTLESERFKNNVFVTGDYKVRFYAGVPITDGDNHTIGTFCAIDQKPKELSEKETKLMQTLAKTAMSLIALRKSRLDSMKLAKAKEEFMSNMSHEIRTPLNAIIGFNDLLRKTELNNTQKEYLDTIRTSSLNLKVIIDDILDYSKLESEKIDLETRPISLNALLDHIMKLQLPLANEKGIRLLKSVDADLPDYIKGDQTRLAQIFNNLISNAIKFTHEGQVELKAFVLEGGEERSKIRFQVTDTGIGVAQENLDKIFERFTQSESSTTRLYGGTGLGLSIVKGLTGLMQGEIKVESTLGKGTCFTVDLSFEHASEEDVRVVDNVNTSQLSPILQGKNVLVLEDNPHNQLLIKNYLKLWGINPTMADNGQDGVDLVKEQAFDAIFMDLQMPVMDGFKATEVIRNELYVTTPIIGCSAHSMVNEKEKCLAIGMNDYVSKPYTEQELLNSLLQFFTDQEKLQVLMTPENAEETEKTIATDEMTAMLQSFNENFMDGFANEVVEVFLRTIPKPLEEFRLALDEKDYENIKKKAHYFTGTFGSLGVEEGYDLCKQTENAVYDGQFDAALETGEKLHAYISKLLAAFEMVELE
ncbi:ATP-binding protein [Flavobacterium sp. ASW18X]|uniref:ATP-binding protein n=1 Tax=Flavobacterium sp. ASW18X TaxID=2572595 RepID=UPI0010ADB0DA|nr:ATP-binding protein [Flavobacterium sp. ASW18X]TKD61844.1 response regulator [Flavobacterium sp. ASW18X]